MKIMKHALLVKVTGVLAGAFVVIVLIGMLNPSFADAALAGKPPSPDYGNGCVAGNCGGPTLTPGAIDVYPQSSLPQTGITGFTLSSNQISPGQPVQLSIGSITIDAGWRYLFERSRSNGFGAALICNPYVQAGCAASSATGQGEKVPGSSGQADVFGFGGGTGMNGIKAQGSAISYSGCFLREDATGTYPSTGQLSTTRTLYQSGWRQVSGDIKTEWHFFVYKFVPSNGNSITVSPSQTTTYTLTCPWSYLLAYPVGLYDVHIDFYFGEESATTETVTVGPSLPVCSDTLDNDNDGTIDLNDPGCGGSGSGATEAPQCNDGIDNDSDGTIDTNDSGCINAADNDETGDVTALLGANPMSIIVEQSSTLTWSSENTTSCTGTNFATGGATSGTKSVTPSATTLYSLDCQNAAGQHGYSNVTVTVGTEPDLTITASPTLVRAGESTTITWNGGDATSCSVLGPGFAQSGVTASAQATVINQSTYTLSCTKLLQSYTESVTVKLVPKGSEF